MEIKKARPWFTRTKRGLRVEKFLVDLPREIQRQLEDLEFDAVIFTPSGTIERRGIVWDGRTAEVYIPAKYGRNLQGDATASIHFVDGHLMVEFEVA